MIVEKLDNYPVKTTKEKNRKMGYFTKFNNDPEKSMKVFNHNMGADKPAESPASAGGESGGGEGGGGGE